MLGRWLGRLHEKEERVTPISVIIRSIGKQVVYICIKKMSIDLKMAAKASNRRNQKKNEKAYVETTGKVALTSAYFLTRFSTHLFFKSLTNISTYVNSGHAYERFCKFLFSNIFFFALPVYVNYPITPQYILFKQASLTKKVMLFDKKPLCAYFLDLDECTTGSHSCDVNSVCQNTVGSYKCSCNAGYTGDGKPCNGI